MEIEVIDPKLVPGVRKIIKRMIDDGDVLPLNFVLVAKSACVDRYGADHTDYHLKQATAVATRLCVKRKE